MKAFLLAAGKGTRLRPYTDTVPKCLMPIGDRTLLEIWISLMERHGIESVLINTCHHADQVVRFVDRIRDRFRIHIELFHEPELLGSGGTLRANQAFVDGEDDFFICYADNLTNMDLTGMARAHQVFRARGAVLTMGLFHATDPRACGIAVLDDSGKIVEFAEKPAHPKSDLANAGVYVAAGGIFDCFPERQDDSRGPLDLGHHILPGLTDRMFGYFIKDYLKDIGTIESYHAALDQWQKRA